MKYIIPLLLTFILQSCLVTYSNRHLFKIEEKTINEKAERNIYITLNKKTTDFPLPFVWVFTEKGNYALTVQIFNKDCVSLKLKELKIYSEYQTLFSSTDAFLFNRDNYYPCVFKTDNSIEIEKNVSKLKLYIEFNLIGSDKSIENFKIEREFIIDHDKGFKPFTI